MMLQFVSLFLWALAGVSTFVFFYGRIILDFRNVRLKFVLILISLVVFVGAALAMAVKTGWSPWLAIPVVVLLVAAGLELLQARIRRRCHGSDPVETRNHGTSLYAPLTTLNLAMRRYEVHDPAWNRPRLRIAHISDLHVHAGLPMAHYRNALRQVAELDPDLLFITGDFLTQRKSLPLLSEALTGAAATFGVFAVLGNHDYWEGGGEVAGVLRERGIRLLGNQWTRTEARGEIIISGCEEPWGSGTWQAPPALDDLPVVILTHTADNIYKLAASKATAVFAGHYHGGQAVLPGWGPIIIPSKMGRRFSHGHFVIDRTHLFVTTGIGAAFPPVRLYCQPEVLVVDFAGA